MKKKHINIINKASKILKYLLTLKKITNTINSSYLEMVNNFYKYLIKISLLLIIKNEDKNFEIKNIGQFSNALTNV